MTEALQVLLILATVMLIVLLVMLIRLAVHARKRIDVLAQAADETRIRLDVVLADTRELIRNVTAVSARVQTNLDEAEQMLHTVRIWTDRTDRIVDEVGSVIEPPIQAMARLNGLLKTGAGAFIKRFFQDRPISALSDS
jgi:hypothetical protein